MTDRAPAGAAVWYQQMPYTTAAIEPAVAVMLAAGFVVMIALVATLVVSTFEDTGVDRPIGWLESRATAGSYGRYEGSTTLATMSDADPLFQSPASCRRWYALSGVFC